MIYIYVKRHINLTENGWYHSCYL